MVSFFSQNDFFPKRLTYDRTPAGAPERGGAAGEPDRRRTSEPREPDTIVESRQKIGELLEDKDLREKLMGPEKGRTLSPKQILANLKKVAREDQASDDWVMSTYGDFYPDVKDGVTPEKRREVARLEYERFKTILGEDATKRIDAITGPSKKPEYGEALSAILTGTYVDASGKVIAIGDIDQGTKALLPSLKLDATNTTKCIQKQREIDEINLEIKAKEQSLLAVDQEIKEHEGNKDKISEFKQWWDKNKWGPLPWIGGYAAKVALVGAVGAAFGGLGYGLLGAAGASVPLLAGTTSAFGSLFTGIGQGLGYLASSMSWGKAAVTGLGTMGVAAWSWLPGGINEWWRGEKHSWKKSSLEKKREKQKQSLGLDKLAEQKSDAEGEIKKYQEENKKRVEVLEGERKKYTEEQTKINGYIEQSSAAGDDAKVAEFQVNLEKVTAYLLNLDSLILVLKSTENPGQIDGGIVLTNADAMDRIGENIRKMQLDAATAKQLMDIAAEKEKEWTATQKELIETKYREGVKREVGLLDDKELLGKVKDFLEGDTHKEMNKDDFNKLRLKAPDMHRLVRTLQNLPKESVLQGEIRAVLFPVFEKAERDLDLRPAREAVRKIYNSLSDVGLREAIESSPALVLKVDPTLPMPTGSSQFSFQKWLEDLDAAQLDKLKKAMQKIKKGYHLEGDELVDRAGGLQKIIRVLFSHLDPELQGALNADPKDQLEKAHFKLRSSRRVFDLAGAGNFKRRIRATRSQAELEEVQKVLSEMGAKLYVKGNDFGLVAEAEQDLGRAVSDLERHNREVLQQVMNHPEFLRDIATVIGEDLPPIAAARNYREYKNQVPKSKLETLAMVFRALKEGDYVYNAATAQLEKQADLLRRNIKGVIQDFERVNGVAHPIHISPAVIEAGFETAKSDNRRRTPSLPRAGITFDEKIDLITDNDQLKEIEFSCREIDRKCSYDRAADRIVLGRPPAGRGAGAGPAGAGPGGAPARGPGGAPGAAAALAAAAAAAAAAAGGAPPAPGGP